MAVKLGNAQNAGKEKKKVVGQLRRNQLVNTFGSGAIADLPDYSVIMAATNYWSQRSPVLHETNLERLLQVAEFREPYVSEDRDYQPDVPAFRFPTMYFCPQCHRLMPYWAFGDKDGRVCQQCNKHIIPSRFVAADVNGHLEDFPYRWWVHKGDFSECTAQKDDKLKIEFSEESGGLESITVTCTACNAQRTMVGCLAKEALQGYHCRGKRPWLGQKREHDDPEPCQATMRGLLRTASNVYFAMTESALTIPPWSSQLQQIVEDKWQNVAPLLHAMPDEATLLVVLPTMFADVPEAKKFTSEELLQAVKKRQQLRTGG